jgi:hypothetical protein
MCRLFAPNEELAIVWILASKRAPPVEDSGGGGRLASTTISVRVRLTRRARRGRPLTGSVKRLAAAVSEVSVANCLTPPACRGGGARNHGSSPVGASPLPWCSRMWHWYIHRPGLSSGYHVIRTVAFGGTSITSSSNRQAAFFALRDGELATARELLEESVAVARRARLWCTPSASVCEYLSPTFRSEPRVSAWGLVPGTQRLHVSRGSRICRALLSLRQFCPLACARAGSSRRLNGHPRSWPHTASPSRFLHRQSAGGAAS